MGLDVRQKLALLSDDSKYDLSCSCGTDERSRRRRGLDGTWLYPVQLASGGTGIMLKTLISNVCSSDCSYCPLRQDGAANRCSLTPDEVANIFMDYLSRQWLLGIFLSSGIVGTPDHTMELLTAAAEILRRKYKYHGYIHLKVIPGASPEAIRRAMQLSNAVSLNIEVPGAAYFAKLSNFKRFDADIVAPLKTMAENTAKGAEFARVKCTTQFIVGAAAEPDRDIVRYTGAIY
ncbi:MAG: radical SAM protein, partial [Lentisphaerae bacterium]|nr:radical SAM protein [Lentisphaerota bacterium]